MAVARVSRAGLRLKAMPTLPLAVQSPRRNDGHTIRTQRLILPSRWRRVSRARRGLVPVGGVELPLLLLFLLLSGELVAGVAGVAGWLVAGVAKVAGGLVAEVAEVAEVAREGSVIAARSSAGFRARNFRLPSETR